MIRRVPRAAISLALVGLVTGIFARVLDHEFVSYDDGVYIFDNPTVLAGLGADGVARAFSDPVRGNWIPLSLISFQLDRTLWGEGPRGPHAVNVGLHALSALLLFLVLARMTGALGRSAFVAAVFAVHPLHVESVAWASERKDVLCGVFWMLSLWFYASYAARPTPRRYALVLFCLCLGLLAKSMLVTLPLLLLLLDYWPLGRLAEAGGGGLDASRLRRAVVEKLPLLAPVILVAALTFVFQKEQGAVSAADALPLGERLRNACDAYAAYLRTSFWPTGLAVFYPHPSWTEAGWQTVVSLPLLGLVSVGALALARSRPYLIVGWLWYLGTLAPVIGLVQVGMQARADRYTYLPQIGLSIMLAWGAVDLLGRGRRARWVLAVAGAASVLALSVSAWRQVGHWRHSEALFERALAVTRDNFVAHAKLGELRQDQGRPLEAERHYAEALRIRPGWPVARLGYALSLAQQGRDAEAISHFERGLQASPGVVGAQTNLAIALIRLGRYADAMTWLGRALEAEPGSAKLHAALAVASERLGRSAAAIQHNREALRLEPQRQAAANNLAWLLATCHDPGLRDPVEATRIAEAAVALAGRGDAALLDTLAAGYASEGRFSDAVRVAEEALALGSAAGPVEQGIRARLALYRAGQPYVEPRADPGYSR